MHIKAGEQQHYQFRTEHGKHYSLTANRSLQNLYFGTQPDAPLSKSALAYLNTVFTANYENYYLSVSSPDTRDYELKFDDYVPPIPTPSPTPTCDSCDPVKTTLNGKVFDDTNAPLDGVTIRARSLSSTVPFDATTTSTWGSYAFNNAPPGVQLEILATRAGYTTRRRVEVLKSNKTGDPNANRYDFGIEGSSTMFGLAYNALSDKPEVTHVTPGRNSSGVVYKTHFILKFSEPMERATVVDNFEVRAFNNKKFTVDTSANGYTVTGPGTVDLLTGTRIWDKTAFTTSWNADDTEVTFTFKEGLALPTDRDSAKTPDYQVLLNRQDGAIKDKSGISRGTAERKFKLTDGDFERSYKFAIRTDETKPQLLSLGIPSGSNAKLAAAFSEPMQIPTLALTIAGGLGGNIAAAPAELTGHVTAAQAAENYLLTLKRTGQTLHDHVTWASLGGETVIDPANPHKVLLTKGSVTFQSGDEITFEAATSILDPAGNSLDSTSIKSSLVVP